LKAEIKKATGARFVKVIANGIKIANKAFNFEQLDINKDVMNEKLVANREQTLEDQDMNDYESDFGPDR
jgi:hypothetical protein